MDKITVIPGAVRGLGNIVSPKSTLDFLGHSAYITSSTDSDYGTVYNSANSTHYITSMEMECPSSITGTEANFTVKVRLYTDGELSTTAGIHLSVNGKEYSSNSPATFTISVDGSHVYDLHAWSNQATYWTGSSCSGRVYVVPSVDSVEVFAEKLTITTGEDDVLASRVLKDGEPVEGVSVDFYTEYCFYDSGVQATENTDWVVGSGTLSKSFTGDGKTIAPSTSTQLMIYANDPYTSSSSAYDWTAPFSVEFDVTAQTDTPQFQIYSNDTQDAYNLNLGVLGHYRITYDGTTVYAYRTVDGVETEINHFDRDMPNARVGFVVANGKSLTYKEFYIL